MRHMFSTVVTLAFISGACADEVSSPTAPTTTESALTGGCHWDCPKCTPAMEVCPKIACRLVCRDDNGASAGCGAGPGSYYVSHDTDECMVIKYLCIEGTAPFSNSCGCGCEATGDPCGDGYCGSGLVCCNDSCGICTEPGGFCTQQACN